MVNNILPVCATLLEFSPMENLLGCLQAVVYDPFYPLIRLVLFAKLFLSADKEDDLILSLKKLPEATKKRNSLSRNNFNQKMYLLPTRHQRFPLPRNGHNSI